MDSNAQLIQKSVRRWLRRTQYLDMKKATNLLVSSKLNILIIFFFQFRNQEFFEQKEVSYFEKFYAEATEVH